MYKFSFTFVFLFGFSSLTLSMGGSGAPDSTTQRDKLRKVRRVLQSCAHYTVQGFPGTEEGAGRELSRVYRESRHWDLPDNPVHKCIRQGFSFLRLEQDLPEGASK